MQKIFAVILFVIAGFGVSAQNVVHDPNAQVRKVDPFTKIRVSSAISLYLSQGNTQGVAVSSEDQSITSKIKTEVKNGVLKIYVENGAWNGWNWSNKHLKAYVSFKSLDGLSGSGGSDIYVSGTIRVPKLKLTVSGGSDFEGAVDINDLNVDLSGGSDVKITGKSVNLKIDASGGGDFKGYELSSDMCYAEGSGGSDLQVRVNKELTVNTSGGSDVYYKGNGVIKEAKTSGGGSVSKRD